MRRYYRSTCTSVAWINPRLRSSDAFPDLFVDLSTFVVSGVGYVTCRLKSPVSVLGTIKGSSSATFDRRLRVSSTLIQEIMRLQYIAFCIQTQAKNSPLLLIYLHQCTGCGLQVTTDDEKWAGQVSSLLHAVAGITFFFLLTAITCAVCR